MNAGPYAWDPAEDDEDARPASNAPAASRSSSASRAADQLPAAGVRLDGHVLDTYVALGIAVVALTLGGVGLRRAVSRPAAVVGMALSVAALLVVAILPTI